MRAAFDEKQRLLLFQILNEVIETLGLRGGRGVFSEDKWLC
jgi:hypothetical protein